MATADSTSLFPEEGIPVKACGHCKKVKPVTEFHKTYQHWGGYHRYCKACRKILEKGWRLNNVERVRARNRRTALKSLFGLTMEQYNHIHASQEGLCAICRKPQHRKTHWSKGGLTRLDVDHCHRTGQIRGLLCNRCNQGLSKFMDDPALLRAAAAYLERSSS